MTTELVVEWLAKIASEGEVRSNTIRTYRSAVRTYFLSATMGSMGANPVDAEAVGVVMKGIQRAKAPTEAEARKKKPPTMALTFDLLHQLEPLFLWGEDDEACMMWAAAHVATYGALRPSELLGSAQNRERALRIDQVQFLLRKGSPQPAQLLPPGSNISDFELPYSFTIRLEITKTKQGGEPEPVEIPAPSAVKALWHWVHRRRDLHPSPDDVQLFRIPRQQPLSVAKLTSRIEEAIGQLTGSVPHLTGKTFRRGAASSLVAGGADIPTILAAGRWAGTSGAMVGIYSSSQAKRQRAAEVRRRLDPSAQ